MLTHQKHTHTHTHIYRNLVNGTNKLIQSQRLQNQQRSAHFSTLPVDIKRKFKKPAPHKHTVAAKRIKNLGLNIN